MNLSQDESEMESEVEDVWERLFNSDTEEDDFSGFVKEEYEENNQ